MELFDRIRTEPDLYYAYQANIAMAFKDEVSRLKPVTNRWNRELVHEIANQAAKNFLDLLIKPIENEESKIN